MGSRFSLLIALAICFSLIIPAVAPALDIPPRDVLDRPVVWSGDLKDYSADYTLGAFFRDVQCIKGQLEEMFKMEIKAHSWSDDGDKWIFTWKGRDRSDEIESSFVFKPVTLPGGQTGMMLEAILDADGRTDCTDPKQSFNCTYIKTVGRKCLKLHR